MNQTYNNDVASKVIDVAIYDSCEPALKSSGDPYPLTVKQSAPGVVDVPEGTIYVRVDGPHQRLLGDDIAGIYPADHSDTSPEEFLPHIALTRRTLPWDRVGPDGDDKPWLALLLFAESELTAVNGSVVSPATVASMKTADKACHDSLIAAGYGDDDTLDFIKVDQRILKSVLPLKKELPMLSHVQHLILEPGETAADSGDSMWTQDPDCYVAIVVGNRLPTSDGAQPPEKYWACLCSVERRADLPWPDQHEPALTQAPVVQRIPNVGVSPHLGELRAGIDQVSANVNPSVIGQLMPIYRYLVVLTHWSFTPAVGGDFEQVVQEMRYTPNGGVLRFGELPVPPAGGAIASLVAADSSLELARVQGGQVKYHGPLVAEAAARSPDFALRSSHVENAGEDDSYASAFEVGRLLAMSNDGVLDDLQQLKQQIVPPVTAPVYGMVNVPQALQAKLWSPDPELESMLGSMVSLPQTAAGNLVTDPTGVASLVQQEAAQLSNVLAGSPAQTQPGGIIDVGSVKGEDLDVQFSQLVALARP